MYTVEALNGIVDSRILAAALLELAEIMVDALESDDQWRYQTAWKAYRQVGDELDRRTYLQTGADMGQIARGYWDNE